MTICITVVTLVVNVLITLIISKQENYNQIITNSRLKFMADNRTNAATFTAEARNIAFMLKGGNSQIDLKPLYLAFEQIRLALKPYNDIDKKIIDAGNSVVALVEQSVAENKLNEGLFDAVESFVQLVNIYDDADWKFIKQQFNSTNKKSKDFDNICDDVMSKYK